ncbi:P-loop containing nucleoside triphosphate hydrolase protein [Cokeromyces recurvatus]|uniref:P-loop containing nucleoside triphosphate hydrolase protein n=1 Tax=Cokeromyces recurvatus TaxID=90255 RepID=UPI00222004FE|nr:P-loop containing nucleoside triphosphate hydrolase protein [Cokeromyces recurvatus]KAI7899950.1 P-loop containing nucleoside triphosphate hydrolase protein [Cokeromyces recurvatus]
MASYHRSRSRHRSPSPNSSNKRHRYSYRERSRSRDKYRSSSHRHHHHHHSSRYDDDRYYSSSSRHRHDNVSVNDKRTHSREPTSRKDAVGTSSMTSSQETHVKKVATPATPDSPSTSSITDAEEALRKKQERVRKWKEAKRLKEEEENKKKAEGVGEEEGEGEAGEETKKQSAIATGGKEAEELQMKEEAEKKQREEGEKQSSESQEEPQLLQQFAAIKKAAAEAEAQEEAKKQSEAQDVNMIEADTSNEEPLETNGKKKWSLEDDYESEEEHPMDVDDSESKNTETVEAERTFKPLQKAADDNKDESLIINKPKKTFLMSSKSTKPKNAMQIGFGLGKNKMTIKKSSTALTNNSKKKDSTANKDNASTNKPIDLNKKDSEEVDPLEAYMADVQAETEKINEEDRKKLAQLNKSSKNKKSSSVIDDDEENTFDNEANVEEEIGSDPEDILALAAKRVKRKDIAPVDHSKIEYESFRKDFYIEPPELREMTPDQVDLLRIELDGIKIRGVNCPKPITKWTHCGLPAGCLEVIRRLKYEKPTSIQAQAIPAIMNGRDVIGVAKTGSGKTIAFLLPMFRHIKDQRPLETGEGPIAIIMTPTRELATQIHRECKPFLKVLNLRAVCAYGGSPIKDQIADLKRGCEIIVCTPGRMIDLLCANSGRVTNLRRVTYLVMDEADRMFDMGFEPQVMKIVNNVRPSRQTVLFSATFPRQMEALARKVLKKPLEITVGGRSVVCDDVNQIVEVREEDSKFIRLLEILGNLFNEEGEEGASALIFVDRHEAADNLLRDLIRRGYPCQSLHGGKDQADRDSTIADFKSGVTNILIATSVAARGLDVKNLKVVINYECPNHMEDYVHRVGRTGRAGNKGTAYTFITPDQDRYAMDICKALKLSGQEIPSDLQSLADSFQNKVKEGKERAQGSGFGGKGLERLDKDRDLVKKIQKKAYGGGDEDDSDEEELELKTTVVTPGITASASAAAAAAAASTSTSTSSVPTSTTHTMAEKNLTPAALAAKKAAAMVAARITAQGGMHPIVTQVGNEDGEVHPVYAEEIVINDYPQKARWRVTNKEQISQITEISGAAITTRGSYFPPGKQPTGNERKLYLFIEGDSEMVVEKAKNEIKRILIEATAAQMEADARGLGGGAGRYQVV